MLLRPTYPSVVYITMFTAFTLLAYDCKETPQTTANPVETTTSIAQENGMHLANLLGTWQYKDQQFTLYNHGSVDQKT